jgi:hypothetical protein
VLTIQTLEELEREAGARAPIAPPRPPLATDASAEPSPPPTPVPPLPALAGATGTVPVPPRATGGPFRALGAALQLAFEVLMTILSGPVRRALGHFGRAGDRFVRGGTSAIASVARLALFLAGMLVLGALLMFFLLLVFHS